MHTLDPTDRSQLLALARASITARLAGTWSTEPPMAGHSPALDQPRSSFVTLRIGEELRGCCGSLDAGRPLYRDVWQNAVAAGFGDPRFPPLKAEEWPRCHVHLSILSLPERVDVADESGLLANLRPHVDGLVLELPHAVQISSGYVRPGRATFLPAVWEQLPDGASFLRQLKRKAGWPADFWSRDIEVFKYIAEEFGDD